jgi:NAD(P)-dependent dehydrogenase (short-subunit alcohol dehydrogenase family)
VSDPAPWSLASGLAGRVALVTGAGGGIGSACVRRFSEAGTHVVACDIDGDRLDLALRSAGEPRQHRAIVTDVTRSDQVTKLVDVAVGEFGRLDILVHTAAVYPRVPFDEVDGELWRGTLELNLTSQFFLAQAAARPMKVAGWGRIITFSSQAATTGGFLPERSSAYAATKGAIVSLTRSLARTLAPHNILVNAIAPGGVRTPMAATLPEEALTAFVRAVPLGRFAEPDEIANGVMFLASDHASYITGIVLEIDGGGCGYAHPLA